MNRHRVFYIENGQRKEELIAGKWVKARGENAAHSHLIISDNLDYVVNPATGKRFTSKSRLRADYKARGYQELGNDLPKPKPKIQPHPEPVGRALYRKWDELGGK